MIKIEFKILVGKDIDIWELLDVVEDSIKKSGGKYKGVRIVKYGDLVISCLIEVGDMIRVLDGVNEVLLDGGYGEIEELKEK